jgi:hypothetical protein
LDRGLAENLVTDMAATDGHEITACEQQEVRCLQIEQMWFFPIA